MNPRLYRRSTSAIFSEVGADVVALHLDRGQCYGMENVTATVWTFLEEPISIEQLCDKLVKRYEVTPETCRSEIEDLMALLLEERLIEPVSEYRAE